MQGFHSRKTNWRLVLLKWIFLLEYDSEWKLSYKSYSSIIILHAIVWIFVGNLVSINVLVLSEYESCCVNNFYLHWHWSNKAHKIYFLSTYWSGGWWWDLLISCDYLYLNFYGCCCFFFFVYGVCFIFANVA